MTLEELLGVVNPEYTMQLENGPLFTGLEQESVPHQLNEYDVPTIGFGHTRGVEPGMRIDRDTAVNLFNEDYQQAVQQVYNDIPNEVLSKMDPSALTALVDVAFNAGPISQVAPKAHQALLDQDFDQAAFELFDREAGVTKVNGEIIDGLVTRRANNREAFFNGLPKDPALQVDPWLQLAGRRPPTGFLMTGLSGPIQFNPQDFQAILGGARQTMDPNSFQNQLRAATIGLKGNAAKTIEVLGDLFEWQGIESFGSELVQESRQAGARYGIPEINSIDDIEEIGDVPKFIQYALAQSVPSLLVGTGAAGVGALAGSLAGPAGTLAGGMLGAFMSSYVLNTGELANEIEEKGGSNIDERVALGVGGFLAGLDTVGLTKILKPIAGPLIKEFGVDALGKELVHIGVKEGIAKGALKSLAAEGLTEGIQEGTIMYSAGAITDTPIDPYEMRERVLTAAAIGAVAGGGFGSFSGGAGAIVNNDNYKRANAVQEQARAAWNKGIADGTILNDQGLGFEDWLAQADVRSIEKLYLAPQEMNVNGTRNLTTWLGRHFGVGNNILEVAGGKGISILDTWAPDSKAMRQLRNTFVREEGPDSPVGYDMFEQAQRRAYGWQTAFWSVYRGLDKDAREALPQALRGEIVTDPTTPLGIATNRIQQLLGAIRDEADRVGISVGYIDNYYPRFFDVLALRKSPELRQELIDTAASFGMDRIQAARVVNKIIKGEGIITSQTILNPDRFSSAQELEEALLSGSAFRGLRPGQSEVKSKSPSLENRRQLAFIPDEALAKFTINDPRIVLGEYIRSAAKRITYADQFGPREEKLKASIFNAAAELEEAGNPLTQEGLNRIYNLADAFLGLYKPITNPVFRKVNDMLTSYNYINLLPLSTLSTLQEPLIALELAGGEFSTFGKAVAKATKDGITNKIKGLFMWGKNGNETMTRSEFREDLEAFGLSMDYAASARLAATFGGQTEPEPALDRIEQNIQTMTDIFFKANLLAPATKYFRSISYASGLEVLKSRARRLAEGEAPVGSARWRQWVGEVRGMGVDPEQLVEWHRRGGDTKDPWFHENAKLGAVRFTNNVVMHPNPANRPMWMNNPHFRLIAQLKGFQTVFGNTVMKRWFKKSLTQGYQQGVRNVANITATAMLMMATAMGMNTLREMLTYWDEEGNPRHKNETDFQNLMRAMERTGFFGSLQFAIDAANAHKFGGQVLDPILGPTVSTATGLFQGAARITMGDSPDQLRTQVLKQIPGLSLSPALREMFREQLKDVGL